VSGRAFDDRIVIGHAGLLRRLRNAVDVGAEGDDGLAAPEGRHPRRRDARLASGDREAVLLEHTGQVLRRLDLLKAEFTEAEHRVHGFLGKLGEAVHVFGHATLNGFEIRLGGGGGGGFGGGRLRGGDRGGERQGERGGNERARAGHRVVLHGTGGLYSSDPSAGRMIRPMCVMPAPHPIAPGPAPG
jgi:hypothetical protein